MKYKYIMLFLFIFIQIESNDTFAGISQWFKPSPKTLAKNELIAAQIKSNRLLSEFHRAAADGACAAKKAPDADVALLLKSFEAVKKYQEARLSKLEEIKKVAQLNSLYGGDMGAARRKKVHTLVKAEYEKKYGEKIPSLSERIQGEEDLKLTTHRVAQFGAGRGGK